MKKFLASLVGIIMFGLLSFSCTIYIARDIMSEKTIKSIMDEVTENYSDEETLFVDEFTSPLTEQYPTIDEYFSEEELKQELTNIMVTFLENLANKEEKQLLDTSSLKELYRKNIKEYEEDTGIIVSTTLIDEVFEVIDENYNITRDSFGDAIVIFEVVYSDQILLSLISGIFLCILVIFILLGKIKETLLKIKTPFFVNGIGTLIIAALINSLQSSTEINGMPMPQEITNIFISPFLRVGITCVVIGIGLVIASNILKHNKSIENSNNAIENLGNPNYHSINNISNTPYKGDIHN